MFEGTEVVVGEVAELGGVVEGEEGVFAEVQAFAGAEDEVVERARQGEVRYCVAAGGGGEKFWWAA